MNFNQLNGIAAILMLASAAVFAADTHGNTPHAASDGHRPQSTSEPHGVQHANEGHGSNRVRVKDRITAVAQTSNPSHTAEVSHASPAADSHAAPAALAGHDASAAHDNHHAPAAKDRHAAHADSHIVPEKSSHAASTTDYCNPPLKSEVAALFDRWNASLRTGDPKKVAANYAPGSILLPTVSNRARFTAAEKEEYFAHFLARRPEGTIDDRVIEVDCNSATDAGLYTFRFADGTAVKARYSFSYRKTSMQWLITSHHSSGMPEKAEAAAEQPVSDTAPTEPAARTEQGPPVKGWVRYP